MKKYVLLLTMIIGLIFVGCSKESKIADENVILEDLGVSTQFVLSAQETIKEVVIQKRQTDEEQKTDKVWCIVTTEDEKVSYQKIVELTYGLYDEQGWLLDEVSVNQSSEWVVAPLKGTDFEEVSQGIHDNMFSIETETEIWELSPENSIDISIESQDTDLEEGKDVITVNVTVDSAVEQAAGQVVVEYTFVDTERAWTCTSIVPKGQFVTTSKPGMALNVTEEELISLLDKQTFSYSTKDTSEQTIIISFGYANNNQQDIIINSANLSDFVIESQEKKQQGCIQVYHCSGTLTKANVVLAIKADIEYYYGNAGWVVGNTTISAEVVSANILGDWVGTYNDVSGGGTVTLSITNIDENGLLTGIYSWIPTNVHTFSCPGSYYVSGTFDLKTLRLELVAGEWIEEPAWDSSFAKQDVQCTLYVELNQIEGRGHRGDYFAAAK